MLRLTIKSSSGGPTPSSGLNLFLSVAGIRNWFVGAGDVSNAFMATPLHPSRGNLCCCI